MWNKFIFAWKKINVQANFNKQKTINTMTTYAHVLIASLNTGELSMLYATAMSSKP